jgi:hypothetical protein
METFVFVSSFAFAFLLNAQSLSSSRKENSYWPTLNFERFSDTKTICLYSADSVFHSEKTKPGIKGIREIPFRYIFFTIVPDGFGRTEDMDMAVLFRHRSIPKGKYHFAKI